MRHMEINSSEILEKINAFLLEMGRPCILMSEALFALDEDIIHKDEREIRENKLVGPDAATSLLKNLVQGGPSWLHVNLAPLANMRQLWLISLNIGQKVGNSIPSVNISLELDKVVNVAKENKNDHELKR